MQEPVPISVLPGTRTAIVTGAGGAIGQAIARQLAREGVSVAAADLNAQAASSAAEAVAALGQRSLVLPLDVTQRAQVRDAVELVRATWGRIDILITLAGVYPRRAIVDLDEAEWDRVLDIHLKGTFLCCQAVLPTMMQQHSGRIVTTASGLAAAGTPLSAAYASAKGGIISFTRVLAKEAEPYGITANTFGPGPTVTPMLLDNHSPEELEVTRSRQPFEHFMEPEEAAEIAVWFTRPASAHITGRVFVQ